MRLGATGWGRQRARWAARLAALALALPARAEAPSASCSAVLVEGRVLVDPVLEHAFDAELLRLVRLGLAGRVQLELTLVHRRPFWLDSHLDEQALDLALTYARASGAYLLDGRRPVDPERLATERVALRAGPDAEGTLEVEVVARVQVVTAASLGQVAGWMVRGERQPVGAEVLGALANDLTRTLRGSCPVRR